MLNICDDAQRKGRKFTKLQIQLQKESDLAEYYKSIIEQDESHSILIHDIKKHLLSIKVLGEQCGDAKVTEYVDELIKSSDLSVPVKMCANEFLNAILSRYREECKKNSIAFHADIRDCSVDFMKESEMTALFCNLLDNAFESALKQRGSFIDISVGKERNNDYTVITMTNSCRANPFSPETGQLTSSKGNDIRHGYGMRSVERIAGMYDGSMWAYYEDDEGIFHTIVTLLNI